MFSSGSCPLALHAVVSLIDVDFAASEREIKAHSRERKIKARRVRGK